MNIPAQVTATPEMLAKLFWDMGSDEQAEFFERLHDVVEATPHAYSLGQMQWVYMGQEIEKRPKAKAMACELMVWIFNRATDFLDHPPNPYYEHEVRS